MSLTPRKIRGRCCQSGCSDCPWGFKSDSQTPQELLSSDIDELDQLQMLAEKYLEEFDFDQENQSS